MSCINALEYLLRSIEERDLERYTLAGIISLLESLNYVYRECEEVREDERQDVILLLEEIHRVAYWGDTRKVLEVKDKDSMSACESDTMLDVKPW